MLYCMHMVRVSCQNYVTFIDNRISDKRNIMRFEGERKAGCSEQNSRSVPLDLLHRLRGCVPQCAQPACVSSKYKTPFSKFTTQMYPFLWPGSVRDGCVCDDWSGRGHHPDPEQPPGDVAVHGQCALLLGRLHTLELG